MSCNHKDCQLEIYDDSKCILHSDKKDKDINEFWKQVQTDLCSKYECIKGNEFVVQYKVTYEHVVFPKFQKDYIYDPSDDSTIETSNFYFTNHRILEDGICSENKNEYLYTDKLIEKCQIEFNQCIFLDDVDLQRYNFQESVLFNDCTFKKQIFLNNRLNIQVDFRKCNFNNQTFDLSNKVFNENFVFINCKNIKILNLTNTYFCKSASFAESRLKSITLDQTYFEGICIFVKTHFLEDVAFKYCTFEENIFFNDSIIHKTINLRHAIFKNEVTFLNVLNKNKNNLTSINITNRETARIIKHSFVKQNNIIEANKFYAIEMQKKEEELVNSKNDNFLEWVVFKIHGTSSNHSQDWLLALYWIIMIGFMSGIYDFYSMKHEGSYPHFQGLYILGFFVIGAIAYLSYCYVKENKLIAPCVSIISGYAIYTVTTHDYYLNIFFIDTINPFTIAKNIDMTLPHLIFKLILSYLIYQFIVSIRQNTRRK